MKNAFEIMDEPDPIKRAIYGQGYDEIEYSGIEHCIKLIDKENKYIKKIPFLDYRQMLQQLDFCVGTNLAGETHTWIKEADGSAKRFKELIKKENDKSNTNSTN